ncbi:MAG: hypothetical protein IPK24_22025 [Kineosporiaceae bacterium]|nr:hypothetical protein [Kineosporiaceae bacterium]MBK8078156.1 hypothetical protein [Kineosporiaceae bacterium]
MEFAIFLQRIDDRPLTHDVVSAHVAGLRHLDEQGRLIAAGPLADGTGGLVLAHFDSQDEAEAFARSDAFVAHGYESFEVQPWMWANRGNGYLLQDGAAQG